MNVAELLQTEDTVYEVIDKPGSTHMKYEMYYDMGGINYFNGQNQRRGYYLVVTPVSRVKTEGGYYRESMSLFGGGKYFLNSAEIKRNSKKAAEEARKNITEELIKDLTERMMVK